MRPPKPTTKRVRELLAARKLSIPGLAALIGRTEGTIRNVLIGTSASRATRRLITDICGAEVWPGVKPKALPVMAKLPSGTAIVFNGSPAVVEGLAAQLAHFGERRAGRVILKRPLKIELPPLPNQAATVQPA